MGSILVPYGLTCGTATGEENRQHCNSYPTYNPTEGAMVKNPQWENLVIKLAVSLEIGKF